MECTVSFNIECKTKSDAEQVAQLMREYFEAKGLSNYYTDNIIVLGSNVKLDEVFAAGDWHDTFKEICGDIDSQYPGLIIRGESSYRESTGMRSQVAFDPSNDGMVFSEVLDDYDTIIFMLEDGCEPEEIAEMTGMSLEKIKEYLRLIEEDEEEEDD